MAANKQQSKKAPRAGDKKPDVNPLAVLQGKYDELLAKNEASQNIIKTLTESNENLKSAIDGMYRENCQREEAKYDQSTMTIQRAAITMRDAYNLIKCPITRREAFKQFVADVIITTDKALQQANEQLMFDSNVNNDMKDFISQLNRGNIAKPALKNTDSYASVSVSVSERR